MKQIWLNTQSCLFVCLDTTPWRKDDHPRHQDSPSSAPDIGGGNVKLSTDVVSPRSARFISSKDNENFQSNFNDDDDDNNFNDDNNN